MFTGCKCFPARERNRPTWISTKWTLFWSGECKFDWRFLYSRFDRKHLRNSATFLRSFSTVWEHLLLQFCTASVVFLSTFSGESFGLQTYFKTERISVDVFGWSLCKHRIAKEEGWRVGSKKICRETSEGKWWDLMFIATCLMHIDVQTGLGFLGDVFCLFLGASDVASRMKVICSIINWLKQIAVHQISWSSNILCLHNLKQYTYICTK